MIGRRSMKKLKRPGENLRNVRGAFKEGGKPIPGSLREERRGIQQQRRNG